MNNETVHSNIRSIFQVNSEVNLYESYTEFWAETINILFRMVTASSPNTQKGFIQTEWNKCMNIEMKHTMFQVVKILDFMGLNYETIISTDAANFQNRRKYRENTNVLSYYIIKLILFFNYSEFIEFCESVTSCNGIPFCFRKTGLSTHQLFLFIQKLYRQPKFINEIREMELFLDEMKMKNPKLEKNKLFLLNNLRMSVVEVIE
jgi:hypothetical protein